MKALVLDNLQKTYSNGLHALKGIDLSVNEGEFFGLLGPNGAGKSTTIGIIASLVNKSRGKVFIFDHDVDKEPQKAKQLIGLVPQEFNFNVFESAFDILVNQAGYYGIAHKKAEVAAEYYLKRLGLWEKAFEPSRFLSGGLKRRLMIARGLIHEPKLLILDEPTAGVDIELRRGVWAFLEEINQKGTTIILTTHYLEEAESLCRQIAIIHRGEIIENTTVKGLIAKMHRESLILDLKNPVLSFPQVEGFEIVQKDPTTLEVSFKRETSLNHLFEGLSKLGYEVVSLRNKANRLEELFLDRVTKA